jgi:hypothetical protein
MRPEDAQARVSYVLALMNGTPRHVAFEVALGRWRAQNTGVDEAAARRAIVRILARTVWAMREGLAARPVPLPPGAEFSPPP